MVGFWKCIRNQGPWFLGLLLAIALFWGAIWLVWHTYADPLQIPKENLWIASGLVLFNLVVGLTILEREPFASYLLLGATLITEILTVIFLYLV